MCLILIKCVPVEEVHKMLSMCKKLLFRKEEAAFVWIFSISVTVDCSFCYLGRCCGETNPLWVPCILTQLVGWAKNAVLWRPFTRACSQTAGFLASCYETGGPKVSVLSLVAQTTQDTVYPATVLDQGRDLQTVMLMLPALSLSQQSVYCLQVWNWNKFDLTSLPLGFRPNKHTNLKQSVHEHLGSLY